MRILKWLVPSVLQGRPHKGSFSELSVHVKQRGFHPKTVVDVGVAYGTAGLYSAFPEAHFILVEPLPEFLPAIEDICSRYDAEYIPAAGGAHEGTSLIEVFGGLTGSSVMNVRKREVVADGKRIRAVRTIALDSLVESGKAQPPILLKLDVQGAELICLDGAQRLLRMTDLVIMETSLFSFHDGMPQFIDVCRYMSERGFCVYDIIGGSYRPLDGALGQVDLVFTERGRAFSGIASMGKAQEPGLEMKRRIATRTPLAMTRTSPVSSPDPAR